MPDIRIATAEDQILLDKEAKYCSYGDTVHYIEPPRIFSRCEGSYVWDTEDQAYLDLQMWYSAVNFGYANPRLNNALKQQIDTLPQIASQYLHKGKIELSEMIAVDAKKKFGLDGRVHFNVGGSQSIEDSLKVVRNATNGKSLMFAFEGGYHGRTLGALTLTNSKAKYHAHFGPLAPGFLHVPFGSEGLDELEERIIARTIPGDEIAAFVVEPVQGEGGYVVLISNSPRPASDVVLSIGRGQLITVGGAMADVFVANDQIADVQVKSQRQLYVFGKAGATGTVPYPDTGYPILGFTNLIFSQCYADATQTSQVREFFTKHYVFRWRMAMNEGNDWGIDREADARKSRRTAWIVASIATGIADAFHREGVGRLHVADAVAGGVSRKPLAH